MALLVNAQHQRFVRWIEIKPDYVLDLLGEVLVIGQLELGPRR